MRLLLSLLNIILLTAAVYLGVTAFYKIVEGGLTPPETGRAVRQKPAALTPRPHSPLQQFDPSVANNLFKTRGKPAVSTSAPKIEELKPTGLRLKLWGTVADEESDQGEAFAVIEEVGRGRKEQQLYKTGDSIQQATIKAILRRKIILTRNGKDEILEMENTSTGPALPPEPEAAPSTPPERITLQRARMEAATQNVNQLLQQVRLLPHFQNGMSDGLRVTNIKPDSIFAQMGLQNGDIITGVDGHEIGTLDEALDLYQSLHSENRVMVEIRRQGGNKTIEYRIE